MDGAEPCLARGFRGHGAQRVARWGLSLATNTDRAHAPHLPEATELTRPEPERWPRVEEAPAAPSVIAGADVLQEAHLSLANIWQPHLKSRARLVPDSRVQGVLWCRAAGGCCRGGFRSWGPRCRPRGGPQLPRPGPRPPSRRRRTRKGLGRLGREKRGFAPGARGEGGAGASFPAEQSWASASRWASCPRVLVTHGGVSLPSPWGQGQRRRHRDPGDRSAVERRDTGHCPLPPPASSPTAVGHPHGPPGLPRPARWSSRKQSTI